MNTAIQRWFTPSGTDYFYEYFARQNIITKSRQMGWTGTILSLMGEHIADELLHRENQIPGVRLRRGVYVVRSAWD